MGYNANCAALPDSAHSRLTLSPWILRQVMPVTHYHELQSYFSSRPVHTGCWIRR